jgi:hypothetical protein
MSLMRALADHPAVVLILAGVAVAKWRILLMLVISMMVGFLLIGMLFLATR